MLLADTAEDVTSERTFYITCSEETVGGDMRPRNGRMTMPQPFAALQPDVRKGSAFPESVPDSCEATPRDSGDGGLASSLIGVDGKAQPFRTSGGRAETGLLLLRPLRGL
jgi:hypothetical protein